MTSTPSAGRKTRSSEVKAKIAAFVEDTDNTDLFVIDMIEDEMRAGRDSKIALADLITCLPHFRIFSDGPKASLHVGDVAVSLYSAPPGQRKSPNFLQIDSRARKKDKAAHY